MRSKRRLLRSWKVYTILDDGFFPSRRRLVNKFYDLLKSPVDVIQLRFGDFGERALYEAAKTMVRAANKRGVPVLLNDRLDAALALGADGVHLGKADMPVRVARKMLGPEAIIGRTVRGPEDLASPEAKGADYVAIGPVFATPLKPRLRAIPSGRIRKTLEASRVPLIAIGGINKDNVREVMDTGIRTVAFVRYGITEKDTVRKIRELRETIEGC